MTDQGKQLCAFSSTFSLLWFFISVFLQLWSWGSTAPAHLRVFLAHRIFQICQIFVPALCFTTAGIYYGGIWPWRSAWPLLALIAISFGVFRSFDRYAMKRRVFILMLVALFSGLSLVRLMDSVHPTIHSAIICQLWTMAGPFMYSLLMAYTFTPRCFHYFVFELHLSGVSVLIITYAILSIFHIPTGKYPCQFFYGIHVITEVLYSALRRFHPRFDDEDRGELELQALYVYISFIDFTVMWFLITT